MNKLLKQSVPEHDGSGIRVISRAASILRTLKGELDGLSLGQIAKRVDLPRSTVQRIIGALDLEGFVVAATATSRVRIGPAFVGLAAASMVDLVTLTRPFLEELSRELDETVDLSILSGDQVVFIDQVLSPNRRLQAVSQIGAEFPPHSCAPGKAILAHLPEADVDAIIAKGLTAQTDRTITDGLAFKEELKKILHDGIAIDRQEHSQGISAVGTVIRNPNGGYAAVSVPVPSLRFRDKVDTYARTLLATCRQIDTNL